MAHKFGEATLLEGDKITGRILNDCGIVYKPESPYIICIMTQGQDFDAQEKVIQNISKAAYDALD